MRETELARAVWEEFSRPTEEDSEERSLLRDLVTVRLGGSELGALALARLESRPGEDSESVARMVLTEAVESDDAFAAELREVLVRVLGARALGAISSGPPPPASTPVPPPPPAYAPATPPPPSHAPAPVPPPDAASPPQQHYPTFPVYPPAYVLPPIPQGPVKRPSAWLVFWLGLPQSFMLLIVAAYPPNFGGEYYVLVVFNMFSAAVGVVLAVVGLARRPVQGLPLTGLTVGLLLDAAVVLFWLTVLAGDVDLDDVWRGINDISSF